MHRLPFGYRKKEESTRARCEIHGQPHVETTRKVILPFTVRMPFDPAKRCVGCSAGYAPSDYGWSCPPERVSLDVAESFFFCQESGVALNG